MPINPFLIAIVAALVIEYILYSVAELLNLKSLRAEPPPGMEDIYEPQDYRKSQEYTRVNSIFGMVYQTFTLVLLFSFWFAGGFNYLDLFVRSWGFGPIVSGLIYFGILLAGYRIITLPFSIYGTFVIEQRFGFNRTTPRLYISDQVKGLALSLLVGVPLLAAVFAIFEYGGVFAWLYAWIGVTLFTLLIQFVAPNWIMPLFNKFTQMEPGPLRDAIMDYTRSVKFDIENIFVVDSSKRSTKSNAFFTGFGKNKRIALFDTLIARHTVPELVAVLAHEVGHYKRHHILDQLLLGVFYSGLFFLLFFLVWNYLNSPLFYGAFFVQQPSVYTGLLFFALLYAPVQTMLSVLAGALSRKNEFEADRFAVRTIPEPEDFSAALKKLYATNLSNLAPHPLYVFLNYSHPTLQQRVRAVERYRARKPVEARV